MFTMGPPLAVGVNRLGAGHGRRGQTDAVERPDEIGGHHPLEPLKGHGLAGTVDRAHRGGDAPPS